MKKILIISVSRDEQKMIEDAQKSPAGFLLPGLGDFQFNTTASFGQDASWWLENAPECLVICLPPDDLMQGYYLAKLRNDIPRSLPIMILSPTVSGALMQLSQLFTKVRMLKTPVEGAVVLRTLVDMTTSWETHKQQRQPRYLTDKDITVSSDFRNGILSGKMKNLSLSGAYFESGNHEPHFKAGDLIKISVEAGAPPSQHLFDARVVWSKTLEGTMGHGYGVAFMNKEEVYNHLLKGL